jgi:glycosyltransferase involved in cell wall biosynthesis
MTSGRRLRVAHVAHGLDVGGLEKLLVEFARHADRERFELRFFSLGDRGALAGDLEALGWPVEALGLPWGFRPSLFAKLARRLSRWGANVVHTHDERPLIYGTVAGWLAGVPRLVHTRHRGADLAATRRQRWLLGAMARLTGTFVCVSEDSARLAIAQGVPVRKVAVIRNGIDLTRFHPASRGCQPSKSSGPAVLVARLSPEKDVFTLLEAAALVVKEDASFRLEIAGDGPELHGLQRRTVELNLTEQVRFLGVVREVPELLARAGLFVLSSRTEGISLTLLEAMASGLPVVATRVGGNPEVVAEGETGLLVPAGDPPTLAAALLRLWRDPAARHALGEASRRRVEEHFDIRRMVARYETCYTCRVSHPPWGGGAAPGGGGGPPPAPPARRPCS